MNKIEIFGVFGSVVSWNLWDGTWECGEWGGRLWWEFLVGLKKVTWRIAVGYNGPKREMMESFNWNPRRMAATLTWSTEKSKLNLSIELKCRKMFDEDDDDLSMPDGSVSSRSIHPQMNTFWQQCWIGCEILWMTYLLIFYLLE